MDLQTRWNGVQAPLRAAVALSLVLCLLGLNRWSGQETDLDRAGTSVIETAEVLYVPDNRIVRVLTLGYDQAAADLLWLRTVDYFAQQFARGRKYRWLVHFVDQVLSFDPRFAAVYHWAGANVLYGSRFTRADIELSNTFYRRALTQFPDDYEAAYRLGLNYYVELKSPDPAEQRRFREQGLSYLEMAANLPGAPPMMTNLVASISKTLGKTTLASQYLVDMYLTTTDPEQRAGIEQRLKALNAESADAMAEAAEQFKNRWHAHFAYVPPSVFSLMGEPDRIETVDVPWRQLVPGLLDLEALNDAGNDPP